MARAGGNTTVPGWNTDPLCTSSCSAKWEAAPFTSAAKNGEVRRREINALPRTPPSDTAHGRAAKDSIVSTGRAPLPASVEPNQSRRNKSSARAITGCGNLFPNRRLAARDPRECLTLNRYPSTLGLHHLRNRRTRLSVRGRVETLLDIFFGHHIRLPAPFSSRIDRIGVVILKLYKNGAGMFSKCRGHRPFEPRSSQAARSAENPFPRGRLPESIDPAPSTADAPIGRTYLGHTRALAICASSGAQRNHLHAPRKVPGNTSEITP